MLSLESHCTTLKPLGYSLSSLERWHIFIFLYWKRNSRTNLIKVIGLTIHLMYQNLFDKVVFLSGVCILLYVPVIGT